MSDFQQLRFARDCIMDTVPLWGDTARVGLPARFQTVTKDFLFATSSTLTIFL